MTSITWYQKTHGWWKSRIEMTCTWARNQIKTIACILFLWRSNVIFLRIWGNCHNELTNQNRFSKQTFNLVERLSSCETNAFFSIERHRNQNCFGHLSELLRIFALTILASYSEITACGSNIIVSFFCRLYTVIPHCGQSGIRIVTADKRQRINCCVNLLRPSDAYMRQ